MNKTIYSLRTKLIIIFATIGILSVGTFGFFINQSTKQVLLNNANHSLLTAASQTASTFDIFIKTNLNSIHVEASLPDFVNYLAMTPEERLSSGIEEEVINIFNIFASKNQYISSYALLDSNGLDVVDSYAPDIGVNKFNRDYFRIPTQTGLPYVSSTRFSATVDKLAVYFSDIVYDEEGKFIGVLRVRYNADVLQEMIRNDNDLAGPQSFAILLDENHIRMAHGTRPDLILKTVIPLEPDKIVELQAVKRLPKLPPAELSTNFQDFEAGLSKAGEPDPFFTTDLVATNEVASSVVVKMKTKPWLVVFAQPQSVFLASIQAQTNSAILLTLVIIALIVIVSIVVGQRLTEPITHLTAVAQQIVKGDLELQAVVESNDEIGQLADAFNMMTKQMHSLVGTLEAQVKERMSELTISMEVGRRVATIRELQELLPDITEFIREKFDLYYTQVYFVNDTGQILSLKTGTGDIGRELLSRRHSLPVGDDFIVGRAVISKQSVVVSDTESSDIHKTNPLLPDTRSEIAIPLIIEKKVIGVLDMQSDRINNFTTDNIIAFKTMAAQLAISIDSAIQWSIAQESQKNLEGVVRQLTRQTWSETLAQRKENPGFVYDLSSVTPLTADHHTTNGDISAPLMVKNEPIGQLAVTLPTNYNLSDDEHLLLTAVAQQLSQKVENLRLFESTQQHATREQLAHQISDKIRASRNIETAMKVAAEELSKALGVARTVVELKPAKAEKGDDDEQ